MYWQPRFEYTCPCRLFTPLASDSRKVLTNGGPTEEYSTVKMNFIELNPPTTMSAPVKILLTALAMRACSYAGICKEMESAYEVTVDRSETTALPLFVKSANR
jgi:hypothetical protein